MLNNAHQTYPWIQTWIPPRFVQGSGNRFSSVLKVRVTTFEAKCSRPSTGRVYLKHLLVQHIYNVYARCWHCILVGCLYPILWCITNLFLFLDFLISTQKTAGNWNFHQKKWNSRHSTVMANSRAELPNMTWGLLPSVITTFRCHHPPTLEGSLS